MTCKHRGLLVVLCGFALWLAACGSIDVRGRVSAGSGSQGSATVVDIHFTRADLASSGREYVRTAAGRPETERVQDVAVELRADITGDPGPRNRQETYHLLQITTPAGRFSGGTAADRNFVLQNVGSALHVTARPGDRQTAVQNGLVHAGSTWVMVVPPQSRVVPWRIAAGGAACLSIGQGDCFDMESMTRLLFLSIADSVSNTVGTNIPLASTVLHELHYVPRVVHRGLEASGNRARGFAFIYHARIEAPLVAIDAFVPLSVLLVDGVNDYQIRIDPASFGNLPPGEMLDRIYVKGELLGGLTEGAVRDQIADALRKLRLPRILILGSEVRFETALASGFTGAAGATPTFADPRTGARRISSRYEAVLLPEDGGNAVSTTLVWQRAGNVSAPGNGQPIQLIFIEPPNSK